MTLTQLRHLVAIVDSGLNITLAASRVNATQPGLSKHIKQLETELGCMLFTRKGRSLESVTPAGRLVLTRARQVVEECANIRVMVANLRRENRGELNVATTHTQARFVLPPVIAELKRQYDDVAVHIHPGGEEQVLDYLAGGEADLVVTSTAGAPPSGGLALPVYRWDRVILVPRGHELASNPRRLTLATLARYPLVSYESSLRASSSLRKAFSKAGLDPKLAVTARDADLIKTYVRAGLGVGILAEMAVQTGDLDDLVRLPADGLFSTCTTWVVLRPDRVLRDFALDFVHLFAPQVGRRELRRALENPSIGQKWPEPPVWTQKPSKSLGGARTRA